jgi:hypothetical protein
LLCPCFIKCHLWISLLREFRRSSLSAPIKGTIGTKPIINNIKKRRRIFMAMPAIGVVPAILNLPALPPLALPPPAIPVQAVPGGLGAPTVAALAAAIVPAPPAIPALGIAPPARPAAVPVAPAPVEGAPGEPSPIEEPVIAAAAPRETATAVAVQSLWPQ